VDASQAYSVSALALENDLPKVLYFSGSGSVKFAYTTCASCAFTSEIVDGGVSTPLYFPALVVDPVWGTHAAYYKNGLLIYAKRNGVNSWSLTTVDSGILYGVSLALDASGNPHLMYRKDKNMVHAYKDSSWHSGDIMDAYTGSLSFGYHHALRISAQGTMAAAYIKYSNSTDANVYYSVWSCIHQVCSWKPTLVETIDEDIVDLALDAQGTAHLTYLANFGRNLKYARRGSDGSWVSKVIDTRSGLAYPVIAISRPGGRARIAYYDMYNEDLNLAVEGIQVFLPVLAR
jgi:hypothetical protein